jgi:hypothetical protein
MAIGLIPILQWLASIQARKRAAPLPSTHPAAKASSSTSLTSRLSTLLLPNENKTEEYMAWSMILYYPLEHICRSPVVLLFPSAVGAGVL